MSNDKVVLKNGIEVTLESSQGIGALQTRVKSRDAVLTLWKKFTVDNLKQVTVKNSADMVIGKYMDMVLDHIEAKDCSDGTVLLTLSLRDKNTEELFTEKIEMLESGQQMHDEAIGDLGQAVAEMAEGGKQ